ncbi:ATP-binding protein [Streptomyces sp. JJ36]|nr:ATP-binding protein [Streptomyces sp. JJ36]
MEFQALPARVGQARRIVSAQLRYWRLDALTDRALLGLTELLTDVHLHGRSGRTCTVELGLTAERLTVSVREEGRPDGTRPPRGRPSGAQAAGGRGPALVAQLGESWGARERHDGTGRTVWFTLPLTGAPAASAEREPEPSAAAGGTATREHVPAAAGRTAPVPAAAAAMSTPETAGAAATR